MRQFSTHEAVGFRNMLLLFVKQTTFYHPWTRRGLLYDSVFTDLGLICIILNCRDNQDCGIIFRDLTIRGIRTDLSYTLDLRIQMLYCNTNRHTDLSHLSIIQEYIGIGRLCLSKRATLLGHLSDTLARLDICDPSGICFQIKKRRVLRGIRHFIAITLYNLKYGGLRTTTLVLGTLRALHRYICAYGALRMRSLYVLSILDDVLTYREYDLMLISTSVNLGIDAYLVRYHLQRNIICRSGQSVYIVYLLSDQDRQIKIYYKRSSHIGTLSGNILSRLRLLLCVNLLLQDLRLRISTLFLYRQLYTILRTNPRYIQLYLSSMHSLCLVVTTNAQATQTTTTTTNYRARRRYHYRCRYRHSLRFRFYYSSRFISSFFFLLFSPVQNGGSMGTGNLASLLRPYYK